MCLFCVHQRCVIVHVGGKLRLLWHYRRLWHHRCLWHIPPSLPFCLPLCPFIAPVFLCRTFLNQKSRMLALHPTMLELQQHLLTPMILYVTMVLPPILPPNPVSTLTLPLEGCTHVLSLVVSPRVQLCIINLYDLFSLWSLVRSHMSLPFPLILQDMPRPS